VHGRDPQVPAQRTDIRRRLGYLPQEVGFPRGFTASALIDYIALLKEWAEPAARHAEVRRVLDLVGLSDLATKRIRAMSGGQRRRVALAQALLGSPPVLILDEPTTGVDPEQRVTLRTVLAEIARTRCGGPSWPCPWRPSPHRRANGGSPAADDLNIPATMPVSVRRLGTLRLQRHPPCQTRNQSRNSQVAARR